MTWPTDAEFRSVILKTACFRCGAKAGGPCLTDPGGQPKRDPYTGRPGFHQRRLDTFTANHRGEYRLPERQRFRPQGVLE